MLVSTDKKWDYALGMMRSYLVWRRNIGIGSSNLNMMRKQ